MRKILHEQVRLGEIDIAAVEIELDTRDEIPQVLRGLQHIYSNSSLRRRIFAELLSLVPDTVDENRGRLGMDLWSIFVLGTLRVSCNWDYDKLQEIANNHMTLRKMLGHGWLDDNVRYPRQTLNDNIRWFTPDILERINTIVVKEGLRLQRVDQSQIHARIDSFVVESDVHFPTDLNLLWDAIRKVVTLTHRAAQHFELVGWRQGCYLLRKAKRLFRTVQNLGEKGKENPAYKKAVRAYIDFASELFVRAQDTLLHISVRSATTCASIAYYLQYGVKFVDQIERRLFRNKAIPHEEKCFSIFEPWTEWITKGKAGTPQELGLRVCIVEAANGFVLHHKVMAQETDVDIAVPITKETKRLYRGLASCSFDKGFHSMDNQKELAAILDKVILPKKGKLDNERLAAEQDAQFKRLRRRHAAVESGINALENHGLDRVLDYGFDGFERYVALAIVARNIQSLGALLQRKLLKGQERHTTLRKAA